MDTKKQFLCLCYCIGWVLTCGPRQLSHHLQRESVVQVVSLSGEECVTATSHKLLLDKLGLRMKDLQSLDNDLMMAVAYAKLPSTWNVLGSCPEDGRVLFEVRKLLTVVWRTVQSRVSHCFIQFLNSCALFCG